VQKWRVCVERGGGKRGRVMRIYIYICVCAYIYICI